MKCPYRDFAECTIEECPSCNYKTINNEIIDGRYPAYMSYDEAIKRGMAWISTRTSYEFISCKLVDGNVQPVPSKTEIINNINKTNVVVNRSIF